MPEITKGLRSILSLPRAYRALQSMLGGDERRNQWVRQYVRPEADDRLLDIGSGPGEILAYLPTVSHFGFDADPTYIQAAIDRYGSAGTFECGLVTEDVVSGLEPFDLALSVGVLHHLTDDESRALFRLAHVALRPGGRLICMDPAFTPDQSRIARQLIRWDRGQNVRRPLQYRALATSVFDDVTLTVRHDLLKLPYTHAILECRRG